MEIGISAYTQNAGSISFQLLLGESRALVKNLPEVARYSHTVQLLVLVASQVRLKIIRQAVFGFLDLNLKIWDSP